MVWWLPHCHRAVSWWPQSHLHEFSYISSSKISGSGFVDCWSSLLERSAGDSHGTLPGVSSRSPQPGARNSAGMACGLREGLGVYKLGRIAGGLHPCGHGGVIIHVGYRPFRVTALSLYPHCSVSKPNKLAGSSDWTWLRSYLIRKLGLSEEG